MLKRAFYTKSKISLYIQWMSKVLLDLITRRGGGYTPKKVQNYRLPRGSNPKLRGIVNMDTKKIKYLNMLIESYVYFQSRKKFLCQNINCTVVV